MQDWADVVDKLSQGYAALSQVRQINYVYNAREIVFQCDKVTLYRYRPIKKALHPIPVMVVFATVNRPEILDLFPEQSFIRGLLENGLDVYLLDWGYPDSNDKNVSISDYVKYIDSCACYVIEKSRQEKINLIGICQGGVLSLGYAATASSIKNLVLITTPIDFQTKDNMIYQWVKGIDIETMTKASGNISGSALTQFFISMRPFELVGKKYLRFADNMDNEQWRNQFLRVEKWLHDAPDQTAASFTEIIKDFYQQNKLVKGEITINQRCVDLKNITIPVLNIIAKEDEIIPPSASRVLRQYIGSTDFSQKIFPSGHIGIYVSEKVGKKLPKSISTWIKQRG